MYLVWGIALPQFNALGRIPDYARMLMLNFGLVSNGYIAGDIYTKATNYRLNSSMLLFTEETTE